MNYILKIYRKYALIPSQIGILHLKAMIYNTQTSGCLCFAGYRRNSSTANGEDVDGNRHADHGQNHPYGLFLRHRTRDEKGHPQESKAAYTCGLADSRALSIIPNVFAKIFTPRQSAVHSRICRAKAPRRTHHERRGGQYRQHDSNRAKRQRGETEKVEN